MTVLRDNFTKNAEEFDALMVAMLGENDRLEKELDVANRKNQGCCMGCMKWRVTNDGRGNCDQFDIWTDEGFYCQAYSKK